MLCQLTMTSGHVMSSYVMCCRGVNHRDDQVGETAMAQGNPGFELIPLTEIAGTKGVLVRHGARLARCVGTRSAGDQRNGSTQP
jgi:hypothetical protein